MRGLQEDRDLLVQSLSEASEAMGDIERDRDYFRDNFDVQDLVDLQVRNRVQISMKR
jgi:hypothetical protein